MAVVNEKKIDPSDGIDPIVLLFEWVLAAGDTGRPVPIPHNTDIVVQVIAISGATITWQGTLDTAGTVWGTVHKVDGTDLTQTVAGRIDQVLESPLLMRPSSAAGTATVRLKATKQWRD